MKIRPLGDRVVVEPQTAEEKSAGGILLPDSAQEKPLMGKIIAVGKGKTLDNGEVAEMSVKKGDVVVYGTYSGSEITVDGKDLKILHEGEILGIVE
ncbi:MAG: co-chaperone GroES [Sedimentisphaeraceae bacterium JB056]